MAPNNVGGTLVYENEDIELVPHFKKRGYRTIPVLYVNGKKIPKNQACQARPNQTLLSFLRDVLNLTGSKLGCAEGGCGACTVMISRLDDNVDGEQKIRHYSVNACLMPILSADGCHVTTVEGIGTVKGDNIHPVQQAMVDMHGSQCGFCTPGIIVAIYALLAENPTVSQMEEHLDGNLCRCTGYRPIWDAARSICTDAQNYASSSLAHGPCGMACRECPGRDECDMDCNTADKQAENEEKKEKGRMNRNESSSKKSFYSSSTFDKMIEYKETMKETDKSWLDQPAKLFPKELMSLDVENSPLMVVDRTYHKAGTWFKPTSMVELLSLLNRFSGECKIVVGNTEVGIETKFKHSVYPRLISPSQSISTLFSIEKTSTHLSIGACTSLSTLQHACEFFLNDDDVKRLAKPIHDMLRWFASTQIRNVACLGGNLVTASPIADMNPMLACLGAKLVILSARGDSCDDDMAAGITRRTIPVSDFFTGYRKVDLKPFELVESVHIPLTKPVFEYIFPFKQARRREDDISIVTSGMRIVLSPFDKSTYTITHATLAFGGMAPKTVLANKTATALIGKDFVEETFNAAGKVIQEELDLPDDVPGGQAQFRKALVSSFLKKCYLLTAAALKVDRENILKNPHNFHNIHLPLPPTPVVKDEERSGIDNFLENKKPCIAGTQVYPTPRVAKGLEDKPGEVSATSSCLPLAAQAAALNNTKEVGKAVTHASAPLHCTGEAIYTDDIPIPPGTQQACLIQATKCNVKLLSIDFDVALETPGVLGIYTHKDIVKMGGDNALGPIIHDEHVFLPVGENVSFVGQVIGICIANTLENAEAGARSVEIKYSESEGKTIVSIEDAIEANSYYDFAKHTLERTILIEKDEGDEIAKVSGSFRCGGQEHFYLETNSTLVVPSEAATNLTIYASTQAVTKTQMYCASATNTPASKVVVRMKRMGGGFGGKETRNVFSACAAAVAAKLSGFPVRLTLGRDVDMSITGGRHAFIAKYSASAIIKKSGEVKLSSLDVELFSNAGCAFDLSGPVMDRALFHVDGPYFWPIFRAVGVPCKTVQPPHTAFRGFGGPQGLSTCEHILDHLATKCKVSGDKLRRDNLYDLGQATPFGMIMGEEFAGKWNVPLMWDRLYNELKVFEKRESIAAFNRKHKWIKRGLSFVPTKFGIAFTAKFMNQGGALVHLYTDGTVLVSHGGTEMGQGLHTKVCQIAAQAFSIPLKDVYINDTSSDKVANTIPTAASYSTDMYGMATLDACRKILKRIEPYRVKLGIGASLSSIASAAHMDRVDLSAHGFFALDNSRCGYDWEREKPNEFPTNAPQNSWKGHPFNYFTQGVVCTEVEIDVLSGNHKTLRSDVLVDVGASVNPMLDIGQIEGAFIQGMGWSTMEEVIYADSDHKWIRPEGRTFTSGPGTYKIPAFNDVPEIFNVSLMDNVDNPFAVHSSKAIGEPPFFLGTSVFYAIKDAIMAARSQYCHNEYFEFRMPATSERIRMSCCDEIVTECISSSIVDESGNIIKECLSLPQTFQPKGSY